MKARLRRWQTLDPIPLGDGIHPPPERFPEPQWIDIPPEEYKRMFSCVNAATEIANCAEDMDSMNSPLIKHFLNKFRTSQKNVQKI